MEYQGFALGKGYLRPTQQSHRQVRLLRNILFDGTVCSVKEFTIPIRAVVSGTDSEHIATQALHFFLLGLNESLKQQGIGVRFEPPEPKENGNESGTMGPD